MRLLLIILIVIESHLQVAAGEYERFEANGKIGLKDSDGSIVLPASFDALGWSDGNFSVAGQITGYRRNNRWGLLNLKKQFITPAQFESLTYPGGDRVIVSKFINAYTIKFGSIDLQGKVAIPYEYDDITLHSLRAVVMIKKGVRYEYGLVDQSNRSILPLEFKEIRPIGSLRYAVQNFEGMTALCSEEGKWVTDFIIDQISDFHFDLAIVQKGWQRGLIDRSGVMRIEPQYREISITGPGQVSVRKADQWKIIDTQNQELSTLEGDDLLFDNPDFGRITLDGKTGLVDGTLKTYWLPSYDYVGKIENQQAVIRKNKKYGLIRLDESVVIPLQYDSICVRGNFVRALEELAGRSSWNLYDTFGIRKSHTSYEWMDDFNGSFFPVKSRGYYGAMDRYGVERIACVYDSLIDMRDGMVSVRFRNQYGIINLEDQWQMMPQKYSFRLLDAGHLLERIDSLVYLKSLDGNVLYFTDNSLSVTPHYLIERLPDGTEKQINFQGQIIQRNEPSPGHVDLRFRESEGYIGIKRDGKFGFVDHRGRLRIANRYDSIGEFHGGIAPVKLLGKWGFINASDQIVIQPTFETVEDFNDGVARISRSGKYGLINSQGNILLDLRYDSIRRLSGQLFLIKLHGLSGLADKNGKLLIEPRFDSLELIDEQRVIVSRAGLFGVLTSEGESVIPIQFNLLQYLQGRNQFLTRDGSFWQTMDLH